jgi:hypothetical protein
MMAVNRFNGCLFQRPQLRTREEEANSRQEQTDELDESNAHNQKASGGLATFSSSNDTFALQPGQQHRQQGTGWWIAETQRLAMAEAEH